MTKESAKSTPDSQAEKKDGQDAKVEKLKFEVGQEMGLVPEQNIKRNENTSSI